MTNEEKFKQAKEKIDSLTQKKIAIQTEIKVDTENYDRILKEVCAEFGVHSIEELREIYKKGVIHNAEQLEKLDELVEKAEQEISEATKKIEEVKENLK